MPTITLRTPTPPAGTTFAAVQIEATPDGESWRIVGAEPTRELIRDADGNITGERLLEQIAATLKLNDSDRSIRCHWVCEDSNRGLVSTGPTAIDAGGRRRRLGGPR